VTVPERTPWFTGTPSILGTGDDSRRRQGGIFGKRSRRLQPDQLAQAAFGCWRVRRTARLGALHLLLSELANPRRGPALAVGLQRRVSRSGGIGRSEAYGKPGSSPRTPLVADFNVENVVRDTRILGRETRVGELRMGISGMRWVIEKRNLNRLPHGFRRIRWVATWTRRGMMRSRFGEEIAPFDPEAQLDVAADSE